MTKKHFEKLAAAVKQSLADGMPMKHARKMAYNIAQVCRAENPHFDSQRFYVACGVL